MDNHGIQINSTGSGPQGPDPLTERHKMDNQQEHIILLAQINQLKDMQIYCLRKEQELREKLTELGYNEYDEQLKEKRNK